ncbi:helix-turn-helix domain-containing protein [Clostridium saccharoperbutylacetonicum]|uniref:helix-turn-helix domain-containing protein n=1 Tax=Clostridium saccharoperbutylacetonicum TaxID=36745 RepID=UPI0039ED8F19
MFICRKKNSSISVKYEQTCKFSYHSTHEDIGKSVGVSRITVSRTLNKFSKHQWICTKYKKIFILNKNSLLEFLET